MYFQEFDRQKRAFTVKIHSSEARKMLDLSQKCRAALVRLDPLNTWFQADISSEVVDFSTTIKQRFGDQKTSCLFILPAARLLLVSDLFNEVSERLTTEQLKEHKLDRQKLLFFSTTIYNTYIRSSRPDKAPKSLSQTPQRSP